MKESSHSSVLNSSPLLYPRKRSKKMIRASSKPPGSCGSKTILPILLRRASAVRIVFAQRGGVLYQEDDILQRKLSQLRPFDKHLSRAVDPPLSLSFG